MSKIFVRIIVAIFLGIWLPWVKCSPANWEIIPASVEVINEADCPEVFGMLQYRHTANFARALVNCVEMKNQNEFQDGNQGGGFLASAGKNIGSDCPPNHRYSQILDTCQPQRQFNFG